MKMTFLQAKHIAVVSFFIAQRPDSIFGGHIAPVEAHIAKAGVPFTIVRLPFFHDNNWGNLESIKGQGKIYGPGRPDASYSSIAVSDIGAGVASILTKPACKCSMVGSCEQLTTRNTGKDTCLCFAGNLPVRFIVVFFRFNILHSSGAH